MAFVTGFTVAVYEATMNRDHFIRLAQAARDAGINFGEEGAEPPDFDESSPRTLGMRLVNGLTQQLDGTIRFHSRKRGTNVELSFPLKPEREMALVDRHMPA